MVCEAINLDENSLPLYANMEHRDMVILVASLLTFYFAFVLVKFLHQVWWFPIRLQYKLKHQGITGPPYKFLHGNAKVVAKMRGESMGKPMDDFSHNIYSRIQPHVCLWTKIYGTNFIYWHRSQPQLFVTDVELTKEIMTNKEDAYPKMEMQGYIKKVLGESLITNDGEKWAKIRKIANHFFHANSLKGMIPEMCASVETMLESWRDYVGKEIEVYKEFGMLATQVISTTAFGSTASEGRPIFEMVAKLTALTVRNEYKTRFPGFSRTSDEVEAEKLEKGIKTSILELVKIREQKFKNGETDDYGSDYLGQIVKIANDPDEKKRITYSQMIDEIKVLYGAGHLTTTTLLSWTVFLLAVHTDWQDTARKEVFEHFGKEKPTSDGIARLKNMNMIINECLRLYPPVVLLIRTVGREVKLGNLTLPPNINLFISVLALHHNPEIWGKDVYSFKPQRFAEGVAKATNNNAAAFIPFGMGSRTCVGLNFTTNEAKITLSMLLQRYKFSLSPNHIHHPADIFLLTPKNGVKVILQKV